MSTRLVAAMKTTDARTALGSDRNRGAAAIRVTAITPAVISPATGVRAPLAALTAVREKEPATGYPWKTPAAALAAPRATNS